jgi:predicted O-methyltransferase YrrM
MGALSQKLFMLKAYLKHQIKAKTLDGVHPPFLFELYSDVIRNRHPYYAFRKIESLRTLLLNSNETLQTIDLGAGSNLLSTKSKRICDIAQSYAKRPLYAQLLFRIANHFRSQSILELGTSLGLSSLYLAMHDSRARVITLEGDPETAACARRNIERMRVNNIEVFTGNFDDTLQNALQKLDKVDLVFFDGNHRKEPTLRYFNECLKHADDNSVFIFDDIHWSPGMQEAWEEIGKHERVTSTADLFHIGLVFFRKELTKQHFILLA